MAKKLKDYYGGQCAELLAQKIQHVYPNFDTLRFVSFIKAGIRGREFLQRQDVFVEGFSKFLPPAYPTTIALFRRILGPELATDHGMFTHGWWLWPVGRYVEQRGLEDRKVSLAFIYELTKRFTGEFAIRPLLARFPKETLRTVVKWSRDPSVHVRRLSSEGIRFSLPWSKRLDLFEDNFDTCFRILDNLKGSPEKFVQKSVGNNVNDLMKCKPQLAHRIISRWERALRMEAPKPAHAATRWIIKHGTRSLR